MLYTNLIFSDDRFKGLLRYAVSRGIKDYDSSTIKAIISAVRWDKPVCKFATLIYIDGLSKTKRLGYGVQLRHFGLPVKKIRGIARDESNALTRLADALAGFVRDAIDGNSKEISDLFQKAKRDGVLVEV
jgi:hypothetical protein